MALTRSTVVANDDVVASPIVGVNTSTIIQNSKPNKDTQAQESKMDYEFDIRGDPVDYDRVVVNNSTSVSEAEMEAEIAAIETQHHRATIEHWLAEA